MIENESPSVCRFRDFEAGAIEIGTAPIALETAVTGAWHLFSTWFQEPAGVSPDRLLTRAARKRTYPASHDPECEVSVRPCEKSGHARLARARTAREGSLRAATVRERCHHAAKAVKIACSRARLARARAAREGSLRAATVRERCHHAAKAVKIACLRARLATSHDREGVFLPKYETVFLKRCTEQAVVSGAKRDTLCRP